MSFNTASECVSASRVIPTDPSSVPIDPIFTEHSVSQGYFVAPQNDYSSINSNPVTDMSTVYYVYYIDSQQQQQQISSSGHLPHGQSGAPVVFCQSASEQALLPAPSLPSECSVPTPAPHGFLPQSYSCPIALDSTAMFTTSAHLIHTDNQPPKGLNTPQKRSSKIRTCTVCGLVLETNKAFQSHMSIHENDRPHKCSFCSLAFNHHVNAKIHLELDHRDEAVNSTRATYSCVLCDSVFSRRAAFKSHMLIHQVDDDISCQMCPKMFKSPCLLEAHRNVEHQSSGSTEIAEDNHYRCRLCRTQLSTLGMLQKHYRLFHPTELRKRISHRFVASADTQPNEMSLPTTVASDQRQSKVDARILLNKICSLKRSKINQSDSHEADLSVPNKSKDQCEMKSADTDVSRPKRARKHRRSTVGRPKPRKLKHTCTVCGKQFTAPCFLNRHMMCHTAEKPFECSICHSRFAQKSSLNTHMIAHSKPAVRFVCSFCNQQFPTKKALSSHFRLKHKENSMPVLDSTHWGLYDRSDVNTESNLTAGTYLFTHSSELLPTYFELPTTNVVQNEGLTSVVPPTSPVIVVELGEGIHQTPSEVNLLPTTQSFRCDKSFTRNDVISTHTLQHTFKSHRFSCSNCPRRFKTYTQYLSHVRLHQIKNASRYSRRLRSDKILVNRPLKWDQTLQHFASTSRQKASHSYRCPDCPNSYKHKLHLDYHRRQYHLLETAPFACAHCSRRFVSESGLKRHSDLIHTNQPNQNSIKQQCPLCARLLSTNSSLRRHMAIHSDERLYKCPHCDQRFKFLSSCSKHMQTHESTCDQTSTQFSQQPSVPLLIEREDVETHADTDPLPSWANDLLQSDNYVFEQQICESNNNINNGVQDSMHAQWETVYLPPTHTAQGRMEQTGFTDEAATFVLYPSTNFVSIGIEPGFLHQEQFLQEQQPLVPILSDELFQATEKLILEQQGDQMHEQEKQQQQGSQNQPQTICHSEVETSLNLQPGAFEHLQTEAKIQTEQNPSTDETALEQCLPISDHTVCAKSGKPILFYGCGICSASFENPTGLLTHSRIAHLNNVPTFECPVCSISLASETLLIAHINSHNSEISVGKNEPLRCPTCPDRSFRSQSGLTRHIMLRHPIPQLDRFKCSLCGARFRVLTSLKAHVRDVVETMRSSVPPTQSVLRKRRNKKRLITTLDAQSITNLIGRPLSSLSLSERYLLEFARSHGCSANEPIQFYHEVVPAIVCSQSERDSSHSTIKSSTCPISSTQLSSMLHEHDSSPTTPTCQLLFRCHLCHRSFSNKQNLRIHVRRHVTGPRFTCPHCKLQFSSLTGKRNHLLECDLDRSDTNESYLPPSSTTFLQQLADQPISDDLSVCEMPKIVSTDYFSSEPGQFMPPQPTVYIPESDFSTHPIVDRLPAVIPSQTAPSITRFTEHASLPQIESISQTNTKYRNRRKQSKKKGSAGRSFELIYRCVTCNKTFTRSTSLRRHELLHTGQPAHTCSICGRSFFQSYALRRHELCHSSQ